MLGDRLGIESLVIPELLGAIDRAEKNFVSLRQGAGESRLKNLRARRVASRFEHRGEAGARIPGAKGTKRFGQRRRMMPKILNDRQGRDLGPHLLSTADRPELRQGFEIQPGRTS